MTKLQTRFFGTVQSAFSDDAGSRRLGILPYDWKSQTAVALVALL